jgi:hypothetical protein
MAVPDIGDNSLGLRSPADAPADEGFDYARTVYIAQGDVFAEISIWETLEGSADTPVISDDEMYQIAATAVSKLSD